MHLVEHPTFSSLRLTESFLLSYTSNQLLLHAKQPLADISDQSTITLRLMENPNPRLTNYSSYTFHCQSCKCSCTEINDPLAALYWIGRSEQQIFETLKQIYLKLLNTLQKNKIDILSLKCLEITCETCRNKQLLLIRCRNQLSVCSNFESIVNLCLRKIIPHSIGCENVQKIELIFKKQIKPTNNENFATAINRALSIIKSLEYSNRVTVPSVNEGQKVRSKSDSFHQNINNQNKHRINRSILNTSAKRKKKMIPSYYKGHDYFQKEQFKVHVPQFQQSIMQTTQMIGNSYLSQKCNTQTSLKKSGRQLKSLRKSPLSIDLFSQCNKKIINTQKKSNRLGLRPQKPKIKNKLTISKKTIGQQDVHIIPPNSISWKYIEETAKGIKIDEEHSSQVQTVSKKQLTQAEQIVPHSQALNMSGKVQEFWSSVTSQLDCFIDPIEQSISLFQHAYKKITIESKIALYLLYKKFIYLRTSLYCSLLDKQTPFQPSMTHSEWQFLQQKSDYQKKCSEMLQENTIILKIARQFYTKIVQPKYKKQIMNVLLKHQKYGFKIVELENNQEQIYQQFVHTMFISNARTYQRFIQQENLLKNPSTQHCSQRIALIYSYGKGIILAILDDLEVISGSFLSLMDFVIGIKNDLIHCNETTTHQMLAKQSSNIKTIKEIFMQYSKN